jgi:predicted nuclease of predicted toxin-antitoxin system
MDLLANENFPGIAVEALRARGHDVKWVRTEAPGISDVEVLNLAQKQNRILITFDKDFGELAFRSRIPAQNGIVLFRISMPSPRHVSLKSVKALESRNDWAGHFSVVEDDRIRMTTMPR